MQLIQQQLTEWVSSGVSQWLNSSSDARGGPEVSVQHVINSVVALQLQLASLDCATLDCGDGTCVLDGYTPVCNCSGNGEGTKLATCVPGACLSGFFLLLQCRNVSFDVQFQKQTPTRCCVRL